MGTSDIKSTADTSRDVKIKSMQDLLDEEEKRKKDLLETQRIRLIRNRGGSLLAAVDNQAKTTLG